MVDELGGTLPASSVFEIATARSVTEHKIKLTIVADGDPGKKQEWVIARFGPHIRIMERKEMGELREVVWEKDGFYLEIIAGPGAVVKQTGKRIGETPLLERCLN
jgi:hypothetical protein